MSRILADSPQTLANRVKWARMCLNPESMEMKRQRERAWIARQHPLYSVFHAAKARAKKKGLPFTICLQDLPSVLPERCPVLDIPLQKGKGVPADHSPSLDRLVPEKGYVPGNVIVVSFRANSMKRDASLEELERLVAFYRELL